MNGGSVEAAGKWGRDVGVFLLSAVMNGGSVEATEYIRSLIAYT